jgi:hypothetical protein
VSVTERLVTLEYIQCENVFSVLIHSFYSHSLLQREELGTSELLLSDILALEEEPVGFIVDHVVNQGAKFCLI